MKQTAVEWLMEQVKIKQDLTHSDVDKAKEMEEEQIISAYNRGCFDTLKDEMKRGEQYYNETFNK